VSERTATTNARGPATQTVGSDTYLVRHRCPPESHQSEKDARKAEHGFWRLLVDLNRQRREVGETLDKVRQVQGEPNVGAM
jgi:hypothetical protein